MADYYLRDGERAFRFRAYPLGFELLPSGDFAEVLVPETVYDIIDYHVRECVKREVRMRVCKNCGRYFAVTGHGGVEYCDRVCDKKGRTCREVGAIMSWTKRRGEDDIFKAYRREYKKRFAWIKAGRIEPSAFYAWGEEARRRKGACEAGGKSRRKNFWSGLGRVQSELHGRRTIYGYGMERFGPVLCCALLDSFTV